MRYFFIMAVMTVIVTNVEDKYLARVGITVGLWALCLIASEINDANKLKEKEIGERTTDRNFIVAAFSDLIATIKKK